MKSARFSFDDKLKPLLSHSQRCGDFEYLFNGPQSIKHLIESLSIPHTELGRLFANNRSIGIDYLVCDGDQIMVQGTAEEMEAGEEPHFVIDGHLGRLASRLRMLGLDCYYQNDFEDMELVRVSVNEHRTLLTRDRRLLMHKAIQQGCLIRSLETGQQLQEVYRRYGLKRWVKPFHRCLRCNHTLEAVPKMDVLPLLEPLTAKFYDEFHICPACKQIYWKGSHYDKMQKLISVLDDD